MTGGRCGAPGSLGRHVLGDPDWCGRRACACGAVRVLPAGTHHLPDRSPLLGFLERLYAIPVVTLEDFATELGIPLPEETPA